MYLASILIKTAAQTYLLKVLLAQTYNLIFILAARPVLWVTSAAIIGVSYVTLVAALAWDPKIISWVIIVVTILIWPSSPPKRFSREKITQLAAECYAETGIQPGPLKYRLGVLAFVVCSAATYLLAFGQTCSLQGECVPFYVGLLNSL